MEKDPKKTQKDPNPNPNPKPSDAIYHNHHNYRNYRDDQIVTITEELVLSHVRTINSTRENVPNLYHLIRPLCLLASSLCTMDKGKDVDIDKGKDVDIDIERSGGNAHIRMMKEGIKVWTESIALQKALLSAHPSTVRACGQASRIGLDFFRDLYGFYTMISASCLCGVVHQKALNFLRHTQ